MSTLKVSVVQTHQYWEDKKANLMHFSSKLEGLYNQTDLVLLPEMFDTAFSMNIENADNWVGSLSVEFLKKHSRKGNYSIYTSLMINDSGAFFNRGVFVFPDGRIVFYDKRKLFTLAKEDEVFTCGAERKIVEFKDWKFNLNICYDLRFPELMRNEVKDDVFEYDIQLIVANWPERRSEHWKSLLKARAIENQCFVVACNRIGSDVKGLTYLGHSVVLNALGSGTFLSDELTVTFELEKSQLIQLRRDLPFLKDK
jgi:omega-amidase